MASSTYQLALVAVEAAKMTENLLNLTGSREIKAKKESTIRRIAQRALLHSLAALLMLLLRTSTKMPQRMCLTITEDIEATLMIISMSFHNLL